MTNTNQEQLYRLIKELDFYGWKSTGMKENPTDVPMEDVFILRQDVIKILSKPPVEDGKQGGEVEDKFIQKHLVKVMDMTADSMIKSKLERMYGGLEMSSVEYFVKTGTINGSFRQRIKELLVDFASKWHTTAAKSQPSTPVQKL